MTLEKFLHSEQYDNFIREKKFKEIIDLLIDRKMLYMIDEQKLIHLRDRIKRVIDTESNYFEFKDSVVIKNIIYYSSKEEFLQDKNKIENKTYFRLKIVLKNELNKEEFIYLSSISF